MNWEPLVDEERGSKEKDKKRGREQRECTILEMRTEKRVKQE